MTKKDHLSTESYKGVRDFYPEDQATLNYIFNTCRAAAESFGYVEYHASILEPSELYKSKGAENEEIINEQTYSFTDRGGREVTLRPEMTPTVARMVAGKRRELGFPLRLFSIPNLFRYERPQRGRLREHWQLNVDLFGTTSPAADAEILMVAHDLMFGFGATDEDFVIRIGSRAYIEKLITEHSLSTEQGRALIALLDRKGKMSADEFSTKLAEIGVPLASISNELVPDDVAVVLSHLEAQGVTNAVFDPSIVRGFDYYTGMVFEVYDTHKDNNRALFGGGRYDNLTALFDEEPITGVGFGMGDVTIRDFLEVRGLMPAFVPPTELYLALASKEALTFALALAAELRSCNIKVAVDFGDKKLVDQIKAATKHSIPNLLVVGENEMQSNTFVVRELSTGNETTLTREALLGHFAA